MTSSENMWVSLIVYPHHFQYPGILLMKFINENVLSLATNLLIVPSKLLLTVVVVSVPYLILCIAMFIDKRKWCSYSKNIKYKNI